MPRTRGGSATRHRILEAAIRLLSARGIDAFSVEAIARTARVAKGLVIYHFGSRDALLRECGTVLCTQRVERLARARGSAPGVRGIDACWDELRRQIADGTTRAWLGVLAADVAAPPPDPAEVEAVAIAAVLDGCAIALAGGASEETVREAYDALWLAALDTLAAGNAD